MPLHPTVAGFLRYLHDHPNVRSQIKAAPDKTLLYAGRFGMAMWKQIQLDKRLNPQIRDKQTLNEVLGTIAAPQAPYPTLLKYVEAIDADPKVPPGDKTICWRALSGIFAAQATGAVSFQIGSEVNGQKVFVATELKVLARNPKVDSLTRELIEYYQKCAQNKQEAMNVGFIAG